MLVCSQCEGPAKPGCTAFHDVSEALRDATPREDAFARIIAELRKVRAEPGHTLGWYDAFDFAIDVVKGLE